MFGHADSIFDSNPFDEFKIDDLKKENEKLTKSNSSLKRQLKKSQDEYKRLKTFHDKVLKVISCLPFSISDFIEDDSE